jgi:hypothetical protein
MWKHTINGTSLAALRRINVDLGTWEQHGTILIPDTYMDRWPFSHRLVDAMNAFENRSATWTFSMRLITEFLPSPYTWSRLNLPHPLDGITRLTGMTVDCPELAISDSLEKRKIALNAEMEGWSISI